MNIVDDAASRLARLERGSLFAGYRIEGLIDRGGMGVVYRASDVDLDRAAGVGVVALTPDLGGTATTGQVTDAVLETL